MENSNRALLPEISEELSKIKLAPSLNSITHYGNFGEFIKAYTKYNKTKKVLVFGGLLGSGKTRSRRQAHEYRNLHARLNGGEPDIGTRTWEHAEKRARLEAEAEGRPFTPKGKPFKPEELAASSQHLEQGISDSVCHYADTEVEAPIVTSINIEQDPNLPPKFIGRELGLKALYNLVRFRGEFANLPPTAIWAAGFSAGAYLREVVPSSRDGIKRARFLEEAQAVAILCGLDYPRTRQEWQNMRLDGATVEETEKVDRQFEDEVLSVYRSRDPHFSLNSRIIIEARLMHSIFGGKSNLGLAPDRYFVGLNDPVLPFPDRELLDEFMNCKGRLRLRMDQIRSLLNHVAKTPD